MKRVRVLTITDIHQRKWMYEALEQAVGLHKPDVLCLVGDFLCGGFERSGYLSESECAARLAALPCEVVFARGNHEMENWEPFARQWMRTGRTLNTPHGDATVIGPLVVVGFPCTYGNEEYFLMGKPDVEMDPAVWMPQILEQHGRAARTLWLLHEPPAYTKLCAEEGLMTGVDEWAEAIERYQPWLTISGHDHFSPIANKCWHDQIGRSLCINAGQPGDSMKELRKLHFCVIDLKFSGDEPSLPERVSVTAYPWNETLVLPDGKQLEPAP